MSVELDCGCLDLCRCAAGYLGGLIAKDVRFRELEAELEEARACNAVMQQAARDGDAREAFLRELHDACVAYHNAEENQPPPYEHPCKRGISPCDICDWLTSLRQQRDALIEKAALRAENEA